MDKLAEKSKKLHFHENSVFSYILCQTYFENIQNFMKNFKKHEKMFLSKTNRIFAAFQKEYPYLFFLEMNTKSSEKLILILFC